jgi:hypothetical protein
MGTWEMVSGAGVAAQTQDAHPVVKAKAMIDAIAWRGVAISACRMLLMFFVLMAVSP